MSAKVVNSVKAVKEPPIPDAAIREHHGLARIVAGSYADRGVDFDELLHNAHIGVWHGVRDFNPALGFEVSTYLGHKMRGQIRNTCMRNERYLVHLPAWVQLKISKYEKAEKELTSSLGHKPEFDAVCDYAGLPARIRPHLLAALRVKRATMLRLGIGGGDGTHNGNDGSPLNDVSLYDLKTASAEVERDDEYRTLRDRVSALPEKQARCIALRFGLDDGRERTLKEVGKAMGFTRERARQIINGGLAALRERTGPDSCRP